MSTESRESRESREFIPLLEQRHIVIDLETLDTSTDAVVLSIGYAWGTHKGYAANQVNLETTSQRLKGRTAGVDTLVWWSNQPKETQARAVENPEITEVALAKVASFIEKITEKCGGSNAVSIWGNSPSFDLAILASLFKQYGVEVPWKYYQEKDLRTLGAAAGISFKEWQKQRLPDETTVVIPHYAKHDAIEEIEFVFYCLKRLEMEDSDDNTKSAPRYTGSSLV